MEFEIAYHRRAAAFKHLKRDAVVDLIDEIRAADDPPEDSRKALGGRDSKGVRQVLKKTINDSLSASWNKEVEIFDSSQVPATKLHYVRDRVGIIRTMQHRTTMGTDILRLEVAHRVHNHIDMGVFICGTRAFEEYYLGTEKKKRENMVVFEELAEYLEMIEDIISVPILIIGLKPPK